MELIIIETDQDGAIEDDLISIVELLQNRFGKKRITHSPALAISTDIPEVGKLLQAYKFAVMPAVAGSNGKSPALPKAPNGKNVCIEPGCGKVVSKPNARCRHHAQQLVAARRKQDNNNA